MLEGGEHAEQVFSPERGAGRARAAEGLCVASVDGRCAYLGEDLDCLLHRRGGATAKPRSCQLYPRVFVDDGEVIRVSVRPECACAFASASGSGGEPLVPSTVQKGADLDPSVFVHILPDRVPLTASHSAERARYVDWARQVAELGSDRHLPEALWTLAAGIEAHGLTRAVAEQAFASPLPLQHAELVPWLRALGERTERRVAQDALWRSPTDWARLAATWLHRAVERFAGPERHDAAGAAGRSAEAFYWRASLHGHLLVGEQPLVTALRDRSLRLLLGRVLPEVVRPDERSFDNKRDDKRVDERALGQPLALVEAMMRAHGLDAYAAEATA